MKKSIKAISLLVTAFMLIAMITGCSGNTPSETKAPADTKAVAAETSAPPASEPAATKDNTIYNMTYFQSVSYNVDVKVFSPEDTKYLAWIRDNYGVAITATEYNENYATELQLLWTSGKLPDIFTLPSDEMFSSLVDDGAIKDLGKYYQNPDRWPLMSQIDKLYQAFGIVNGVQYCFLGGYSKSPDKFDGEYGNWVMIPKSYYNQFGIDIKTYDDLKKYCQAVLDSGIKTADGSAVYPLGGSTEFIRQTFQEMYGLEGTAGKNPLMTADGKWVPAWGTNEMYNALQSANECWRLGYFDPETFSQDGQTLNSKLYNAQIALFCGSYGEADAFIQKGYESKDSASQWAWSDKWIPVIVPKVSANDKALGTAGYTVFPNSRTVISATVEDAAVDKFADFVEWRNTDDGMFSDIFEGWPGETWKYNDEGKAIPYYSWWPNKDPKEDWKLDNEDAQQHATTGNYWQIYNRFQNMFGPAEVSLQVEKGSLRKINIWWSWIRLYTVPTITDSGTAYLKTPSSVINYTEDVSTISADMDTVFNSWVGKIITAKSPEEFQANYDSMISELSALDVATYSKDIAAGWSKALETNPGLADLKFPKTATALESIASSLN